MRCAGIVALVWLAKASPAVGLDIALAYAGGFENRPDAMAAMEHAAAMWEARLTDSVTVQIDVREVSLLDLPFGANAATFPAYEGAAYPALRAALVADAISGDDAQVIVTLLPSPRMSFRTWDVDQMAVLNNGDDSINNYLQLTRANARALGLPVEDVDLVADAEIQWSDFDLDKFFDFDRSDGVDGSDFLGVALHEIGHALGFGSGVDSIDGVFAGVIPVPREEINEYSVLFPLDLFRYSAESAPFTELTPGSEAYFSIDGGATSLATFATGENFGDGWQAGHWQPGQGLGIMDANLPDDAIHNLTALDLRVMDVIGWDRAIEGDFNRDRRVDLLDLMAWRANFGVSSGAATSEGDADQDGDVDGADFLTWQRELGSGLQAARSLGATPEPSTAALSFAALAWLAAMRLDVRWSGLMARRREPTDPAQSRRGAIRPARPSPLIRP
jgi:hypothetical protein